MITFKFMRQRAGETEIWSILIPASDDANLVARFGKGVRVDVYEDYFHEAGELFVVHSERESEFILACHFELSENERNALLREVMLLTGREVFMTGSEFEPRWVLHDQVQAYVPTPRTSAKPE